MTFLKEESVVVVIIIIMYGKFASLLACAIIFTALKSHNGGKCNWTEEISNLGFSSNI